MPSLGSLEKKIDELMKQMREMMDLVKPREKERDPSIAGFCKRHGFTRRHYTNLRHGGKAPRETATGTRRTISEEAEAEWLHARQEEAEQIEAARATKREQTAEERATQAAQRFR